MRESNIQMLEDTLQIMKRGYYQVGKKRVPLKLERSEFERVIGFLPDDIEELSENFNGVSGHMGTVCRFSCENVDSFTLARRRVQEKKNRGESDSRVLVLNLANPVNPGGGVRRGAKAQEEDLCRKSSLLCSLESRQASRYYDYNRSLHTNMGSHAIMIHPFVEIIKDENGNLLEDSVIMSVMTCAAPMVIYGIEDLTEEEYQNMLLDRMKGMLKVASFLGYSVLILGAFGCGAFHNDAHLVSDLFKRALEDFQYAGKGVNELFERIDFAVLSILWKGSRNIPENRYSNERCVWIPRFDAENEATGNKCEKEQEIFIWIL